MAPPRPAVLPATPQLHSPSRIPKAEARSRCFPQRRPLQPQPNWRPDTRPRTGCPTTAPNGEQAAPPTPDRREGPSPAGEAARPLVKPGGEPARESAGHSLASAAVVRRCSGPTEPAGNKLPRSRGSGAASWPDTAARRLAKRHPRHRHRHQHRAGDNGDRPASNDGYSERPPAALNAGGATANAGNQCDRCRCPARPARADEPAREPDPTTRPAHVCAPGSHVQTSLSPLPQSPGIGARLETRRVPSRRRPDAVPSGPIATAPAAGNAPPRRQSRPLPRKTMPATSSVPRVPRSYSRHCRSSSPNDRTVAPRSLVATPRPIVTKSVAKGKQNSAPLVVPPSGGTPYQRNARPA